MRYCVFGAGAVGGSVAAALTEAGFPTDTIARGAHLKAMRENGLQIKRAHEAQKTVRVQAFTGRNITERRTWCLSASRRIPSTAPLTF